MALNKKFPQPKYVHMGDKFDAEAAIADYVRRPGHNYGGGSGDI